jgi:hypothetical protein
MQNRAYVEQTFGTTDSAAQITGRVKQPYVEQYDNNVLQLPTTWELFQLYDMVMAISVTVNGENYTYTDVCFEGASNPPKCQVQGCVDKTLRQIESQGNGSPLCRLLLRN